jgi:pimeloyl-ACP methyl ester carboxylesterase
MNAGRVLRAGAVAYREARPDGWAPGDPAALLVHGWPQSSYMWRDVLPALAGVGYRAVAPDLHGYGDSEPDPPGTWERHVEALERFRRAVALERPALVVHDWGVMIGLRWACDHADSVSALVISDGGFFADRRWHHLANVLRTPGDGEAFVDGFTREAFDGALRAACARMTDDALDEYWKAFADPARRSGTLELYRSGDFDKLAPYEGRLGTLGVPTLIVWGADDPFSSVDNARRFHEQIPGSELLILDRAGHFVWEDEPGQTAAAAAEFLARLEG